MLFGTCEREGKFFEEVVIHGKEEEGKKPEE
jgi:hypothetical protein